MYRRIIILSVIILIAVAGLAWLGFRAIEIQAEGLTARRWGEFAAVAEQIRRDVNRKLDDFIQKEQSRPYTDYQHYYVPDNVIAPDLQEGFDGQQQMPLLVSPLADRLDHHLAYGHFQIEPDGSVSTPYQTAQEKVISSLAARHLQNIEQNLLANLNGFSQGMLRVAQNAAVPPPSSAIKEYPEPKSEQQGKRQETASDKKTPMSSRGSKRRGKSLPIESLQNTPQDTQAIQQRRSVVELNQAFNEGPSAKKPLSSSTPSVLAEVPPPQTDRSIGQHLEQAAETQMWPGSDRTSGHRVSTTRQNADERKAPDTVQIRIEPFTPISVPRADADSGLFGSDVFLLRHVQIENRHILQGFQLNADELRREVQASAKQFVPDRMCFELSPTENPDAAYAAVLDFGFGRLVLNLMEVDPGWIPRQVSQLRNWYFSIIAVVFLAVTLGLMSLWRSLRAQINLARKKDDFISAVSHELRTPLTSLRMYTEMLEKNWVKSDDKRDEYYRNMRLESERLSRLIENVLDFSRLQRNAKHYSFQAGDINLCIERVVDMMTPYAHQAGFTVQKDLHPVGQLTFDSDAVMQIVINLMDNAVKYAAAGPEKRIIVRTRRQRQFVLIEVEDRGPGLAHRERKKVFNDFYRCEDKLRKEIAGVGLGLALVKKFAHAHNGFVDILASQPAGAIFRVALLAQNHT